MNITYTPYHMNYTVSFLSELGKGNLAVLFDLGLFWNLSTVVLFIAFIQRYLNEGLADAIQKAALATIIYVVALLILGVAIKAQLINANLLILYGLIIILSFILKWRSQF